MKSLAIQTFRDAHGKKLRENPAVSFACEVFV